MRAVFGLLSLVLVLAIVGLLVKKSWQSSQSGMAQQMQVLPQGQNTPGQNSQGHNAGAESANVRERSQQIQQEYRQQLESALQAQPPRAEPAP